MSSQCSSFRSSRNYCKNVKTGLRAALSALRPSRPKQRLLLRRTTHSLPMLAQRQLRSVSRRVSAANRLKQRQRPRQRKKHSVLSPAAKSRSKLYVLRSFPNCVPKSDRTPSTWLRNCSVVNSLIPLSSHRPLITSCPSSTLWHRPESRQLGRQLAANRWHTLLSRCILIWQLKLVSQCPL